MRPKTIRGCRAFRWSFPIVAAVALFGACAKPASAGPETLSCTTNPEARQLDFWLGEWNIAGEGSATSKVYLELDKCLVVESWDGGRDHRGKNIFAYAAGEKSWRGMFVDNEGRAHVFENGKAANGVAEFFGPSRGPNGEVVLNRIRIARLGAGKVEQSWDKSTDNGTTWTNEFRLEYSRKN